MKVYEGQFDRKENCVLALGSFDALHRGHMALIRCAKEYAGDIGAESGVYMFDHRPAYVLYPDEKHSDIFTKSQREDILLNEGIDFIYYEKFDRDFMHMSAESFAKMLKEKFSVSAVVVGFDYRFGYKGEGGFGEMQEYGKKFGFETIVIEPVMFNGKPISSTEIKNEIAHGNVENAQKMLGRYFYITSDIVHDRGVGSKMDMPTANIVPQKNIILPQNGVYAVFARVDGEMTEGVCNIGIRPTFGLDKKAVEVHILDFKADIYGKKISIEFVARIRDEIKFKDKNELLKQIKRDIFTARTILLKKKSCGT